MKTKPWNPQPARQDPTVLIDINPQVALTIAGHSKNMGLPAAVILGAGAMMVARPFSMYTLDGKLIAEFADAKLRYGIDPRFTETIMEAVGALTAVQNAWIAEVDAALAYTAAQSQGTVPAGDASPAAQDAAAPQAATNSVAQQPGPVEASVPPALPADSGPF